MTTVAERLPAFNPLSRLVPGAALRRLQRAFRERALPPCTVEFTDGSLWRFGHGDAALRVKIRDLRGQLAVMSLDEMRCAEAYMAGSIDVDGDFRALMKLRAAFTDHRPLYLLWARHLRARLMGQVRSDVASIADHYDEDPDFYLAFLCENRCYSHGIFERDDEPLGVAIRRKLDFALDAVGAQPGQRILDVGAGWGAMTEHAGKRGVRVTSLTLSERSERYVRDLIAERDLPCEVVQRHLLEYRSAEPFDAIVNLGVSEHLPDYEASLARYAALLKPGGRAYLDFCSSREKHPFSSFMHRYIFPGNGTPVCLHEYLAAVARSPFEVVAVHNDRLGYARTCEHWARNLERHEADVVARYGQAWYRRFRLWLWGCVDVFERDRYGAYRLVLQRA